MLDARGPKSGTASSSLWFSFLCGQKQKGQFITRGTGQRRVSQTLTAQSGGALWRTQRHLAAGGGCGSGPWEREEKQGFTWQDGTKTNGSEGRRAIKLQKLTRANENTRLASSQPQKQTRRR